MGARNRGCGSQGRSFARGVGLGVFFLARAATAQDLNGPAAAAPQRVEDLRDFSIDQLAQLQVTSVSKSPVSLAEAPAAIYVITHDDIIRSGATSIPEILRLAPNLQVMQTSASQYVITARGFSGNAAAQNFSDKLLVLIDGRTVYTPLFSGVYWDLQNVLPDNIDHIEVISGPGATLWGANAVNGVINIITRKSSETQGGLVDVGGGNLGRSVSLQYGGRINDDLTHRAYAKDFVKTPTPSPPTGAKAHDHWSNPQGGFRFDWAPGRRGHRHIAGRRLFRAPKPRAARPTKSIAGRNLLARWNHAWQDGLSLQVQAYYDRAERGHRGQRRQSRARHLRPGRSAQLRARRLERHRLGRRLPHRAAMTS